MVLYKHNRVERHKKCPVSTVKEKKKNFTLNYCVLLSQREENVMNELDRDKK